MSSLTEDWVAKANARQRRGRAGRVREGDCYYTYSRSKGQALDKHTLPEMLRVPLEQIVLQVKLLGVSSGDPYSFLAGALQPPPKASIKIAVETLTQLGALSAEGSLALTPLGRHMASIPADCRTARMLLFGAILGTVNPKPNPNRKSDP